jgi:hypothetical protein
MELNLTYEGCTLAISAVHERGGRVLVELCVEGEPLGSLELSHAEASDALLAINAALDAVETEAARRVMAEAQTALPL